MPRPLRAAAGAVAEKLPSFHGRRFAMRGSGGPEKSYQRASMNYMWDEIPNVLKDYDGPCKPWEWCKPHFDEAAKQNLDIITQTQYVDMVSYMPFDICLKADKMSMSQSPELRVPFLDKKVLDVALQLPTACRVDDDHAKYALRVAASKLGFQKKVANMPKQPFITPLTVWLQTDLYYDRIKQAFTGEAAHEFFNVDYLVQMLDDWQVGRLQHGRGSRQAQDDAHLEHLLLPVLVRGVLREIERAAGSRRRRWRQSDCVGVCAPGRPAGRVAFRGRAVRRARGRSVS